MSNGQCLKFDLNGLTGTYQASDSYPEPYLIGPPCAVASTTGCKACAGAGPAPAFQLEPGSGCSGSRCYPIGDKTDGGLGIAVSAAGIALTLPGESRRLVYSLVCNSSGPAASSKPVSVLESAPMTYVVRHIAGTAIAPPSTSLRSALPCPCCLLEPCRVADRSVYIPELVLTGALTVVMLRGISPTSGHLAVIGRLRGPHRRLYLHERHRPSYPAPATAPAAGTGGQADRGADQVDVRRHRCDRYGRHRHRF